ncbi:hypothetical protein LOC71_09680 [Rhodopirellula sp. JC740]|uniref:FlgN protein n=1 Tax=Rhodopirellula halodulae TaxID=2894198 RepID=A0ABS8NG69_9BACT|nr:MULTISPECIES: hypothetical protein [unclassified Rhodopirellula]MCC9642544.1 hypothetical protein [Rhodopirellula sp. JC740]MCC9655917.1 hypothetical protein [Rhodopirellula sp. JC737]
MSAPNTGEHPTWAQRVADYVDELVEITEAMDLILDETRVRTVNLKPDEVDESTQQLAAAITQLEAMVERRDTLLRDPEAPPTGLSLSEKLLSSRRIEDARLARRCGEAAEMIKTTHQRANALFVCQYHLTQFQSEMLDRLAGVASPATYGNPNAKTGQQPKRGGGELFNEAA